MRNWIRIILTRGRMEAITELMLDMIFIVKIQRPTDHGLDQRIYPLKLHSQDC